MGSELVSDLLPEDGNGQNKSFVPVLSYSEQFNLHLPFYLSIGMTPEQYWDEDCCLTKAYRKAYEIRRDRKNWEAWLQGLYIYEALCDVSPVLNAFAKEGTRPAEYAKEPYALTTEQRNNKQIEAENRKYELGKAKMNAFMERFNIKFSGKGENDGRDT